MLITIHSIDTKEICLLVLQTAVDHRILSYNSLENRRYQTLRMKQPVPRYVTRIYEERCKSTHSTSNS